MDKQKPANSKAKETRAPIEFYRWEELKPKMGEKAKTDIERAFYKHILGLKEGQIASYENALYGTMKMAKDDIGFGMRALLEPGLMNAELERRFGGPLPNRMDYRGFWDDVFKVMPIMISQDDVDRLAATKSHSVTALLNAMNIMHLL